MPSPVRSSSWPPAAPEPVDGPLKMLVLAYDAVAGDGRYELPAGKVTMPQDLRTLDGDAAKLVGGADIRVGDELARANPQTARRPAAPSTSRPSRSTA